MTKLLPALLALTLLAACEDAAEAPPAVGEAAPATPAPQAAAPAAPSAEKVAVIRGALSDVQAAMDRLDADGARDAVRRAAEAAAGDPRAEQAVARTQQEVDVLGREVGRADAAEWYTTAADPAAGAQVVVFWEVWCPHCRREMPELSKKHETWSQRGVDVVGLTRLSRGTTDAEVRAFIDENHLTYPIGRAEGESLAGKLNISGVPAAAVLRDGVVVWRGHPARLTEDTLTRVASM